MSGEGLTTFVFRFYLRENGRSTYRTEERDCNDWTEAYGYFGDRMRELGVTGENIGSCSFGLKENAGTCGCFGGANIPDDAC